MLCPAISPMNRLQNTAFCNFARTIGVLNVAADARSQAGAIDAVFLMLASLRDLTSLDYISDLSSIISTV